MTNNIIPDTTRLQRSTTPSLTEEGCGTSRNVEEFLLHYSARLMSNRSTNGGDSEVRSEALPRFKEDYSNVNHPCVSVVSTFHWSRHWVWCWVVESLNFLICRRKILIHGWILIHNIVVVLHGLATWLECSFGTNYDSFTFSFATANRFHTPLHRVWWACLLSGWIVELASWILSCIARHCTRNWASCRMGFHPWLQLQFVKFVTDLASLELVESMKNRRTCISVVDTEGVYVSTYHHSLALHTCLVVKYAMMMWCLNCYDDDITRWRTSLL